MASEISPKAEVSPKAKIGDNVKIFPFAYIEDDVEIGDGCIIFPGGGKESIELLVKLFNGEDCGEKIQLLDVPMVTIDNVEEYYERGY